MVKSGDAEPAVAVESQLNVTFICQKKKSEIVCDRLINSSAAWVGSSVGPHTTWNSVSVSVHFLGKGILTF